MKTADFIAELAEVLEYEGDDFAINTDLTELDGYDSLSTMSIIALVDENFNKKLTADQLKTITTVESLMQLIGKENFTD